MQMLNVRTCRNRILQLENEIRALDTKNPTEEQKRYIESLQQLKIAYALEMAKAIDRRENGEDESSYS